MPTATATEMVAPVYRHRVLTRSMLTGGIGFGARRIGGFHYQDGGDAGGGAGGGEGKGGAEDPDDEGGADESDGKETQREEDRGIRSALQKERDARKAAEKSIKAFERRIAEIEGKDKSDVERLTGERDKLLKDLDERSGKLRLTLAEQAVRDAAESAGARNPKLVFRIVRDDLDIDEDGSVSNLDAAIKDAKKSAPELFGAGNGKADGGRGGEERNAPSSMNALIRQKAGYSG